MARKFANGIADTGPLTVTQPVTSSGTPNIQVLTGAANTGLTASTEVNDVTWALNRTVTWATGAITTQRAVLIQAPTYAFAGGSTITNAATVAISGAPAAGTNATITNAYALWLQAGTSRIDGKLQIVSGTPTISDTAPLSIIARDTDGYCFTVESPSMSSTPAFSVQNIPLSTDLNTGKAFQVKVTSEANGRVMFYSDGKYAVGPGSATRDTVLGRSAANTFRITSDGASAAGHLEVMGRISVGASLSSTNTAIVTQAVATTGSPSLLVLTGGAHTTLSASTEAIDVNVNLNRTVQFATGAISTQRAVLIQAPTYGFVAASTITTAASFAINGAPTAGTNATITNAHALWVQAGRAKFDGTISAQRSSSAGVQCEIFGELAANSSYTAQNIAAFGYNAMHGVTSGSYNVGIGANAGAGCTTGTNNTFAGDGAGQNCPSGSDSNTFLGSDAGLNAVGNQCIFVGVAAGKYQEVVSNIIGIGYFALPGDGGTPANNTGTNLTAVGWKALNVNSSGSRNAAFGDSAGLLNVGGTGNTFLGSGAGAVNVTGNANIFLGSSSGDSTSNSASHRLVAGSSTDYLTDVFFGMGETNAAPQTALTIHTTAGVGTNLAGTNLILAPGPGTGTGSGGYVKIQTAKAGTTGTTAGTLVDRATFQADGGFNLTGIATASAPAVSASSTGTIYYDSTLQVFRMSVNGGAYATFGAGGSGTVTSVALSAPAELSVSGSPVTSSGTLALSWATQTANKVFAGPTSGGAATPGFRLLVAADLPTVDVAHGGTGSTSLTSGGVLYYNGTVITNGSAFTFSSGDLSYNRGTGANNEVFGSGAGAALTTGGDNNTFFGNYCGHFVSTGHGNTAIGNAAGSTITTGTNNVFLGYQAGDGTASNASNRFVVGGASCPIYDIFFGGESSGQPFNQKWTIHGCDTQAGFSDVGGGDITIMGGRSNGNAAGGDIIFQTSAPGTSGSTQNTPDERFRVGNNGLISVSNGFIATLVSMAGVVNNYQELNNQNGSNGNTASTDLVCTADTGSSTTQYIDLGINGSSYSANVFGAALEGYLYTSDNNLNIGAAASGKVLRVVCGGTDVSVNLVATFASALITANVPITTKASATGAAGLNIPAGTAPTAPVAGDMWGVTDNLLYRANGKSLSLVSNRLISSYSATNLSITADLNYVEYTGPGGHTFSLPAANVVSAYSFAILVKNRGTGNLTLAANGTDTIEDGASTSITLFAGQSRYLIANKSNAWSVN